MNVERIICAAVHYDDGNHYEHQYGMPTGLVLCGKGHHNVFPAGVLLPDRFFRKESGFITTKNRFVGREEGGKIAFAAGQTTQLWNRLTSERIY